MTTLDNTLAKHHKGIIIGLVVVIAALLASCTFHSIIPACHWIFGCDHKMHAAVTVISTFV